MTDLEMITILDEFLTMTLLNFLSKIGEDDLHYSFKEKYDNLKVIYSSQKKVYDLDFKT